MIIKNIIQIGNPILSRKLKSVLNIKLKKTQGAIRNLIDSLHYDNNLIGISAPQIGKNLRIFITEIRKTKNRNNVADKLRVFINPKIIWSSKSEVIIYEGCGSVAYSKIFGPVRRPRKIIIEALDEKGNRFELKADKMLSRVIQHEYDHLDGITFIEKVTDIRKVMSLEEYRKMMIKKTKK
ncbi:MAG: peptide deformylase [bacterium]